ncbi:MAG TPA: metal-dependent hydrolase [Bryobacteraceae bacterium]|nr:metal-dependent hydrolase [Bryobacteraceae bacterium]
MENLTHSLVGLFLARAGLKRMTPQGTAILVLAANAPDLDVVSWLGGPTTYIHWHRNITHSLIALPVMALVAVALVRLIGRKPVQWLPAWLVAMVAVASHLILDLTNVYGVRLLLPFSGRWFHWDLTPVIDLVIVAIMLLGVAAPAFGRLVGSEIGERKRQVGGGWAVFALLLLTGYDYGRSVLHDRAVALMDSRIYNGLAPRRTGAFPEANPMRWTGIGELSNAYVEVPIDLRGPFRPESLETFYKAEHTAAVQKALETAPFQRFLEFVQYPIWVSEPAPEMEHATRIRLVDLRFGTPPAPGFEAVATINDRGDVVESAFTFGATRPR